MNEEQVKGNWKQLTGQIKKKWGKLTDNDLMEAEGHIENLAGKIQVHYGKAKEEALTEVNDFFKFTEIKLGE